MHCVIRFLLLLTIQTIQTDEDRFVTFGVTSQGRLLTVSHTDRGNVIGIISARLATNVERQIYEED